MILVQMKMPKLLNTLVFFQLFKFELIKIVKFWVLLLSWIWIRIQPTKIDADPCGSGSGSETLARLIKLLTYR
jgi:hypothetical protein